jgi:hypothetical protein
MARKVVFDGLVKDFKRKALVSGDLSFQVMIQSPSIAMRELADAPADKHCTVTVEWDEE